MSIIDTSYFRGIIELPTDNSIRTNKLQLYIDIAEKKYLERCLGYELYKLFNAELPTPTSARFTAILNGAEYTDSSGRLKKWLGLVNSDKDSFLAYFAYYEYSVNNQKKETGLGVTSQMFENSNLVSPAELQVNAYNLGLKLYNELYEFMYFSGNYTELYHYFLKPVNYFGL